MWIALCGLNFLLFAPSFAFQQGHRNVFRISYEFGLFLAALVLASRFRGRAVARVVGVAAYVALLLFLTYQHAIVYYFQRTPALWEDWRLIINLGHYAGDFLTVTWWALAVGAGALLIVALVAMERLFAGFQQW